MTIYEGLTIATFAIVSLMMIEQYLDSFGPKLKDVLSLVNIFPCYGVKVYRKGKLLRRKEWLEFLTSSVHYSEFTDGILYISID